MLPICMRVRVCVDFDITKRYAGARNLGELFKLVVFSDFVITRITCQIPDYTE